jgi:hypothetical protein
MGILLDDKVWVAFFIKVGNNFMLTTFATFLYVCVLLSLKFLLSLTQVFKKPLKNCDRKYDPHTSTPLYRSFQMSMI